MKRQTVKKSGVHPECLPRLHIPYGIIKQLKKRALEWLLYQIRVCRKGQSSRAQWYNSQIIQDIKILIWHSLGKKKKIVTRAENGRTLILSHDNIHTQIGKCTTPTLVKRLLRLVTWLNFRFHLLNPCQQLLIIFNGAAQGDEVEWHYLYF